ncbi:MAG: SMC-Scp complex subunit ScpB [Eubacterium sp.]|nr:SMC-Scp complex subunit ScpB [Eubacterium sp.]
MGELEAVLFAMGEPLGTARLADAIQKSKEETEKLLRKLKDSYNDPESGIRLMDLEGSWQLCTKEQYFEKLKEFGSEGEKPQLTDVVMETLSIIACKQPVTRSQIEKIRGVSCEHAVSKLLDYELIEEKGRLEIPGKPIILGTTDKFLRYFGMESISELPVLDPVQIEDFKMEAEAEVRKADNVADV